MVLYAKNSGYSGRFDQPPAEWIAMQNATVLLDSKVDIKKNSIEMKVCMCIFNVDMHIYIYDIYIHIYILSYIDYIHIYHIYI